MRSQPVYSNDGFLRTDVRDREDHSFLMVLPDLYVCNKNFGNTPNGVLGSVDVVQLNGSAQLASPYPILFDKLFIDESGRSATVHHCCDFLFRVSHEHRNGYVEVVACIAIS